ncbi:hypothetical protein NQZ68_026289 [Dissostichus eleginoides]|nr:hypothetical protein NQZ68_026289 [Dissostichus eleginoides]
MRGQVGLKSACHGPRSCVHMSGGSHLLTVTAKCPAKSVSSLPATDHVELCAHERRITSVALQNATDFEGLYVKDMVLLLLSYFDEKEDTMFCYVEDTCLAGEVQMDQVQLTPTIVVCGRSCYSSKRYMLSVDRNIVQDNIPSLVSALSMMFGSYYCFNIAYPSELASTLEFVQRCFFSINPEKGTKVEKTRTSRLQVNPRVLTLIQELSDHEWRDV